MPTLPHPQPANGLQFGWSPAPKGKPLSAPEQRTHLSASTMLTLDPSDSDLPLTTMEHPSSTCILAEAHAGTRHSQPPQPTALQSNSQKGILQSWAGLEGKRFIIQGYP